MARAGLGSNWDCLFANDFDAKKCLTYQSNWGALGGLKVGDIKDVSIDEIEGDADLAWASFPCQDLSLAGGGAGLKGERSGTFYPFWEKISELRSANRAPKIVVLENVVGTLTSHGGKDFNAICKTYAENDYRYGAVVINADLFVPQSRPRLFFIGIRNDIIVDDSLLATEAVEPFHTRGLKNAFKQVTSKVSKGWLWWNVPTPARRNSVFADLVEDRPVDVSWHTSSETQKLLKMMSPINLAKIEAAKRSERKMVGCLYKRTRIEHSKKVQRAEVRFDDKAGCLRTPAGGSSRQIIVVIEGNKVQSRLISARETARLMGLDESYKLPRKYNEAYHLTGDGVVVPVVRHITHHILEPVLQKATVPMTAVA